MLPREANPWSIACGLWPKVVGQHWAGGWLEVIACWQQSPLFRSPWGLCVHILRDITHTWHRDGAVPGVGSEKHTFICPSCHLQVHSSLCLYLNTSQICVSILHRPVWPQSSAEGILQPLSSNPTGYKQEYWASKVGCGCHQKNNSWRSEHLSWFELRGRSLTVRPYLNRCLSHPQMKAKGPNYF